MTPIEPDDYTVEMLRQQVEDERRRGDQLKMLLEDCRKDREGEKDRLAADEREKVRQLKVTVLVQAQGDLDKAKELYDFITEGESE